MEVPSHRACAFCRSQKVRCIMAEENDKLCQRCAKAGRTCVFTPIEKRKQRKRTDTRVAELEREMKMMRSMLKEKQQAVQSAGKIDKRGGPDGFGGHKVYGDASQTAIGENVVRKEQLVAPSQREGTRPWPGDPHKQQAADTFNNSGDVIARGLISIATARQLYNSYRVNLFPHYPMVYVPASVTADEMRETKPTLFLAILAAAAGMGSPDVSAMLDREILHAYAAKSLIHSEKSLELVQALLLSSVWYHPPNKFGQLKYYEYIHMAATMALDIGIGTRRTSQRSRFGKRQANGRYPHAKSRHPLEDAMDPDLSMTPRLADSSPNTGDLESRRTFLACFIICAAVSMSLRRPNMLRVSSYIRESVDYLERARDAVPTDRTIVAWVKLMIIQDEIGVAFAYDDPGGIAHITELRTQLMLKDFDRRLTEWRRDTPEDIMTGTLDTTYYTARLYLHEIALHVDHSPEDFKAPYQMGVIEPWRGDEVPTPILAESIAECINSAHSLLNTFLAMSPESLRAVPVFGFVRVSFAAFILAKLCLSAAHPESRIGQILDRDSLEAESFLERAIHHVREVVGTVRSRVPAIFLALLFKLRAWCLHPEMIEWEELDDTGSAPAPRTQSGGSTSQGVRFVELSSSEGSPAYVPPQAVPSIPGSANNVTTTGVQPQAMPEGSVMQRGPARVSFGDGAGAAMHVPEVSGHDMSMPSASYNGTFTDEQMNDLIEHMDLDSQYLNYFGDLNALSEDGLAGLEGLDSVAPTDLQSFDGGFGYQFPAAADGAQSGD